MRTFNAFFVVFMKKYIQNKLFIISLLLLPLSVWITVGIFENSSENSFKISVYFEEKTQIGDNIIEKMLENQQIIFELAQNQQEIYDKIVNEDSVCGYIFPKDFEKNIENLRLSDVVISQSLEGNAYSKFTDIVVYSYVFEEIAPFISKNKLKDYEIELDLAEAYKEIENSQDEGFSSIITYANGNLNENEENSYVSIIFGEICILLLVLSFISTIYCSNTREDMLFLPILGEFKLRLFKSAPIYFLSTLFAVISIIFIDNSNFNLFYEIFKIILYQISLFLCSFLIMQVISKNIAILFMPILLIFVVITHPIFMDISLLFLPVKDIFKFLPTYQYLNFEIYSYITTTLLFLAMIFLVKYKKTLQINRKYS